jgi:hypothetical protein
MAWEGPSQESRRRCRATMPPYTTKARKAASCASDTQRHTRARAGKPAGDGAGGPQACPQAGPRTRAGTGSDPTLLNISGASESPPDGGRHRGPKAPSHGPSHSCSPTRGDASSSRRDSDGPATGSTRTRKPLRALPPLRDRPPCSTRPARPLVPGPCPVPGPQTLRSRVPGSGGQAPPPPCHQSALSLMPSRFLHSYPLVHRASHRAGLGLGRAQIRPPRLVRVRCGPPRADSLERSRGAP